MIARYWVVRPASGARTAQWLKAFCSSRVQEVFFIRVIGGTTMTVKPSEQEEEYFARQEFERRKKALAEQESNAAEEERLRVLAVARNRCPKCGAHLVAVPYRGVELDKCSRCQGVWFDCGELDQVVAEEKGFIGGLKRVFG
jgi:hypothetical protein